MWWPRKRLNVFIPYREDKNIWSWAWTHWHFTHTQTMNELGWLALDRKKNLEFSSFCFSFDRTKTFISFAQCFVYISMRTIEPLQFQMALSNYFSKCYPQVILSFLFQITSGFFKNKLEILDKNRRCGKSFVWLEKVAVAMAKINPIKCYSNTFSIWKCHSKSDTKPRG